LNWKYHRECIGDWFYNFKRWISSYLIAFYILKFVILPVCAHWSNSNLQNTASSLLKWKSGSNWRSYSMDQNFILFFEKSGKILAWLWRNRYLPSLHHMINFLGFDKLFGIIAFYIIPINLFVWGGTMGHMFGFC
jgi:hypothetical protein